VLNADFNLSRPDAIVWLDMVVSEPVGGAAIPPACYFNQLSNLSVPVVGFGGAGLDGVVLSVVSQADDSTLDSDTAAAITDLVELFAVAYAPFSAAALTLLLGEPLSALLSDGAAAAIADRAPCSPPVPEAGSEFAAVTAAAIGLAGVVAIGLLLCMACRARRDGGATAATPLILQPGTARHSLFDANDLPRLVRFAVPAGSFVAIALFASSNAGIGARSPRRSRSETGH